MPNEHDTFFPYGAEWVRADFHLHTLKETGASRKQLRAEFRERENEFVKEWVAQLVAAKIRIAVVTNHNTFHVDEYKALRKAARREGILVLPGVELGINAGQGIHALIVFAPDWVDDQAANDGIQRFLNSKFTSTPDEGSRTVDDIPGCLEKLDSYDKDYFVVFAHVDSDNGLIHELGWGQLKHVIETCGVRWQRVLGLQKVMRPDTVIQHWPVGPPPAFVEGSDPTHSIAEISQSDRPCWLKIGDLSFESIKFALTDYGQRVRLNKPEPRSGPMLHSVSFAGGLLDGQEYGLSEQLTTLIGSRGGGKSSVIECLRYALGIEPSDVDARYKNDLVKAMLANGGEVIVTGRNEHDQLVEVRRPLGFDPQVQLEGNATRLRPGDVFPNVLYFGQKDLGSRHESFEADFFARLTGAATADDQHQETQLVQAVRQAVADYQSVLKAKGLDDEYAQEQERLKHQLAVYAEKGVEDRLSALTVFDTDRRGVEELLEQLKELRNRVSQQDVNWRDVMADWPELKSVSLQAATARLATLLNSLQVLKTNYDRLVTGLQGAETELESIRTSIRDTEHELQEGFAQLQREIDEPGLNLEEYRRKKSRYGQLVKLQQAAANRIQAEQTALSKVLTAAQTLHRFRRELHRKEEAALEQCEKSIPNTIKLTTQFEDDRESFGRFLAEQVKGTGFRTASRDRIVEQLRNGLAIFEHRDKLQDTLGATADVDKLRTALFENLAEFLTWRVPDRREITFDGTPVRKLSLGQRATAILTLLTSLDRYPIMLLDQPEDDLDNETIFRHVVAPLLERKKHCQFVIATHNANIPVLGDAEQIHACREVQQGQYDHQSGSLDCPATSKTIVDIMEGGAEAFLRRQKVLQQWTKSVSGRNS